MAITWQTPYGVLNSTGNGPTSLSPAYSAGTVAGDVTLIVVGQKPNVANGGTLTTPDGFTLIGSITGATDGNTGGYGTTLGADTGNMNLYVLAEVATTSKSGTINLVMTQTSSAYCYVARLSNATGLWDFAAVTGKDTTAGNVSVTFGSNPGVTAGDFLLAAFAIPTDVTTPAQFSAQTLTQTGVTFSAITEVLEFDNAGGNDCGGFMVTATANSGTASAAPVLAATAGGTTTNVRGPAIFVRLREVAGDTTAPTLTSPTATTTGVTTASGTVSTDEANGTLYYLATTNATELVATVKAGSSQAVSATGVQNVSFTGLNGSTTYYAHYVHTDAANNDSARVSSASFTTYSFPAITVQPVDQTVAIGDTATFSVTATGNPSVSYQWEINNGTPQFHDEFVGTAGQNLTARGFTVLGLGASRAALDGSGGVRAQSGGDIATIGVDTGSDDQYVEVVLGANFANTSESRRTVLLRVANRSNYYACGYNTTEGLWELWDGNSRSGTFAAATPTAGSVLRAEISSAGVVVTLDSVQILANANLDQKQGSTYAGLYIGATVDTDDVIRDFKTGALFTAIASDSFTGIGTALLGARTMNNALGGSGVYQWAQSADNFTGNGADAIVTSSANAPALVEVPGVTTARMYFDPSGGTSNVSLHIKRNNTGPTTGLLFLLASAHTSLRVASFTNDVRTDHATLAITAPAAPFWMEIEIRGLTVTCRILSADLQTRNSVSHTFTGSYPVGGDFCGPAFFLDGSTGVFDSLILRGEPLGWGDVSGATSSSYTTPVVGSINNGEQYRVKVSNSQGFVYSDIASLIVSSSKPIKYWNGSAWIEKPIKYWNGSAWIEKPIKYWNGSAWI